MAQQGQDPSKAIQAIAAAIKGRMAGDNIEDVIAQAFAPEPVSPEEATAGEAEAPGQVPSGVPTPQGGAPMPAPQGGGGALQNLLAGLSSSGQPSLAASVSRRSPA
jgi:hypothetical protein